MKDRTVHMSFHSRPHCICYIYVLESLFMLVLTWGIKQTYVRSLLFSFVYLFLDSCHTVRFQCPVPLFSFLNLDVFGFGVTTSFDFIVFFYSFFSFFFLFITVCYMDLGTCIVIGCCSSSPFTLLMKLQCLDHFDWLNNIPVCMKYFDWLYNTPLCMLIPLCVEYWYCARLNNHFELCTHHC